MRWPCGRFETSCFSNCGQSPPEITATLATPSSPASSADISASSADLLSASVPSRSNTISFFKSSLHLCSLSILNQSFCSLPRDLLGREALLRYTLRHVQRTHSRADYGGTGSHGAALPARAQAVPHTCAPAARARTWPTTFCAAKATLSSPATGARKGRKGEIDLIGWDGNVLCFIEVKTRSSHAVMPAEAAVDRAKQRELRGMASQFLRSFRTSPGRRPQSRFDVVSVYLVPGTAPEIDLFKEAFSWRSMSGKRRRLLLAAQGECVCLN